MSFFSNEPLYIGIETTSHHLRIAVIKKSKQGWDVVALKEVPSSGAHSFIAPFEKKSLITTVLAQRQVMVRTLTLDLKRESDVQKALEFQIEPHLPFPIEEAILQAQIRKGEEKGFQVTVFALKESALKEDLERH